MLLHLLWKAPASALRCTPSGCAALTVSSLLAIDVTSKLWEGCGAQTVLVQPFDKTSIGDIERAIMKSDLGMTPSNDGNVIRLLVPQLTKERRSEMAKIASKLGEDAKVHSTMPPTLNPTLLCHLSALTLVPR
jgi:hypothetical protein